VFFKEIASFLPKSPGLRFGQGFFLKKIISIGGDIKSKR
jgi:hypothetical protein